MDIMIYSYEDEIKSVKSQYYQPVKTISKNSTEICTLVRRVDMGVPSSFNMYAENNNP